MSVLVWIEQTKNSPLASGIEALGAGRKVADDLGTTLTAAVIGAETAQAAEAVSKFGVDEVLTFTGPVFGDFRLSAYAAAMQKAVAEAGATVVLVPATVRGREVAATVACQLGAGYAPDAVDLRVEGGKLVAVRSIYSNNILVDVGFSSPVQVASLRPRSFPMPEAGASAGAVKAVDAGVSEDQVREKMVETKSTDTGEISLTDASKIVSGGRGVAQDPAKGFALITELAGAIGAAVGASRAAVDAGFIPYKHQVGQTGKTVKPDLYIAVGISGAIQHLAGMGSSKMIVAVNKDADAPIFERATYGVVGDLYEFVPALTAEFKKRLG